MAKKARNNGRARRIRLINQLVKKQVAQMIALKQCAAENAQAIEMRLRKELIDSTTQSKYNPLRKPRSMFTDAYQCPRLYNAPHISAQEADHHMRNSEYRVCEKDGLKLY